jgi:hypothetical protein
VYRLGARETLDIASSVLDRRWRLYRLGTACSGLDVRVRNIRSVRDHGRSVGDNDLAKQFLAPRPRRRLEARETRARVASPCQDNGARVASGQNGRVRVPSPPDPTLLRDAPKGARSFGKRVEWGATLCVDNKPDISGIRIKDAPGSPVARDRRIPALGRTCRRRYDEGGYHPEAAHARNHSSAGFAAPGAMRGGPGRPLSSMRRERRTEPSPER